MSLSRGCRRDALNALKQVKGAITSLNLARTSPTAPPWVDICRAELQDAQARLEGALAAEPEREVTTNTGRAA